MNINFHSACFISIECSPTIMKWKGLNPMQCWLQRSNFCLHVPQKIYSDSKNAIQLPTDCFRQLIFRTCTIPVAPPPTPGTNVSRQYYSGNIKRHMVLWALIMRVIPQAWRPWTMLPSCRLAWNCNFGCHSQRSDISTVANWVASGKPLWEACYKYVPTHRPFRRSSVRSDARVRLMAIVV